jgi:hypothetical protein
MAHLLSLLCLLCLLCLVDRSSSSCAVVQDDPADCPETWPVGPDGSTCVPRPAGYNGDGTNRDSELEPHPYVPFPDPYNPGGLVPNICPQYPDVCCSNNQMFVVVPVFILAVVPQADLYSLLFPLSPHILQV